MSSRTEPLSALFSKTLRRRRGPTRKPLRKEANDLVEGKVARRSSKGKSKKTGKPTLPGASGKGAGAAAKEEDILAQFHSDVELKSSVEAGRKTTRAVENTDRERQLGLFTRTAADSPKTVNELLSFGLETQQARTIEQMLGKLFGQPVKPSAIADVRKAQQSADKLIATMKTHWDRALPRGETRDALLKSAYDRLRAELKKNPELNPSRFIRKELFDPWRKRFMQRLGGDRAFVAELRSATGVKIAMDGDVPRFQLDLEIGRTKARIGFDVDHAEQRLSDAVKAAKRPADLASVIESDGMQLLTPRENRIQIEALRKATREYFERADEATLAYFRRAGTSGAALNRDIDNMLRALDEAGDML
jgi:hypothetical protein